MRDNDVAAERRNPQIPVTIGETPKAELEIIAEYLGASVSSLVRGPFDEWHKSPTFTSLLRRARNALESTAHLDALAAEVGEDNEHIQALRKLLS